ncbi:MAG: SUMF1/EgtB/PvdO family nonheme iron enzyme [Candidatus Latescibacteria bacterium]|nr:SUMF1/EgtB/PvdO family nonheme iron enzyme [Candidatus Latescibacterota bacterium]
MRSILPLLCIFFLVGCASFKTQTVASPDELAIELPGGATMEFVWIEPGMFMMGSPNDEKGRKAQEGPQHAVTVSQGFYMGKYAITRSQWVAVMGTQPWAPDLPGTDPEESGGMAGDVVDPAADEPKITSHFPATSVSWHDVQAFIDRLEKVDPTNAYRLPTEAEWEYACRAGTATPWSFGSDKSMAVEYARDTALLAPGQEKGDVSSKRPNSWGLFDMHGWTREWTQDWWGSYTASHQTDPQGPGQGDYRVVRSGGWTRPDLAATLRSAARHQGPPNKRLSNTGARLIMVRP